MRSTLLDRGSYSRLYVGIARTHPQRGPGITIYGEASWGIVLVAVLRTTRGQEDPSYIRQPTGLPPNCLLSVLKYFLMASLTLSVFLQDIPFL